MIHFIEDFCSTEKFIVCFYDLAVGQIFEASTVGWTFLAIQGFLQFFHWSCPTKLGLLENLLEGHKRID